jgi:hypothetical protein
MSLMISGNDLVEGSGLSGGLKIAMKTVHLGAHQKEALHGVVR